LFQRLHMLSFHIVGSHGSASLLFMAKVTVWWFVTESHKIMTALNIVWHSMWCCGLFATIAYICYLPHNYNGHGFAWDICVDTAECCSYPPADLFTHCAHETGVGESMPCLTSLLICQERDCGVVKWLQHYLVTYFVESNLEV
jgi:hypothetical protein